MFEFIAVVGHLPIDKNIEIAGRRPKSGLTDPSAEILVGRLYRDVAVFDRS
ncbi:hypothetical protein GCM10027355_36790 [Haloplanus salinarum]|jgi:hypothetical protein|uniref:hypothetical protein n=1 Tax=Haloplanus salinarum TaxID=1912324 RepID=UPI003B42DC7A